MSAAGNPRLENLLAALAQGLSDDVTVVLERETGLAGRGAAAVLALGEFLGGTTVGRLAEVLDLTHSGAVRLVSQLEQAGLAERAAGADRRTVEVRLTPAGRDRERRARAARAALVQETLADVPAPDAGRLEDLLATMVSARVRSRLAARARGGTGPWWCRTCDFAACGRPDGHCPARTIAAGVSGSG